MEPKPSNKLNNKETGVKGEAIAAKYLAKHGYKIVGRNYLKKWGEIDIIAKKDSRIHFIEVKAVSYETKRDLEWAVAHETWRPEENVHPFKIKKLSRAIESWLIENNWEGEWQIDVISVRIVPRETYGTVKYLENIII